jgi:hypothetical protein
LFLRRSQLSHVPRLFTPLVVLAATSTPQTRFDFFKSVKLKKEIQIVLFLRMSSSTQHVDKQKVSVEEIESLAMNILLKQGHPRKHAKLIFDAMLHAELRGNSQVFSFL